jgi:2-dehydro-3-deoxygluconokinase
VIYDRALSAIACAEIDDFVWEEIINGVGWFHFTGINPALSDSMAKISLIACQKAKDFGITVSCDINYRSKLWIIEKARSVMSKLMKYVDVYFRNEEDAR